MAEQVDKTLFLVGLFHYSLQLLVGKHLVSGDIYFVNLDFLVLVDYNVDNHFVLVAQVGCLPYVYFHVVESFLLEVCRYDFFRAVDDVLRNLVAYHQVQTFLNVFPLAFFHSVVVDLRYARLLAQVEQQPRLVTANLFYADLNLREQSLSPESFCRIGYVLARNLDYVAYGQTGISYYDIVFIVL